MPAARHRFTWLDAVAAACLCALVALLFGTSAVVDGWTSFDDPAFVWFVHRYAPATYLSSPDVWQEITPSNFTPLLVLRFELDYMMHGLSLWHYSLLNVAGLAAATAVTFALLRSIADRTAALIFAAAFVVNPSTVVTVHESSTSHYVFGLVFAITSLMLFDRAIRRDSLTASLAATGLLFLAMLSKEVYVPWALLFGLLWMQSRRRLRHLVAVVIALAIYFAWRTWMLGSAIGGYAPLSELSLQLVVRLLYGIAGAVTGSAILSGSIAIIVACGVAAAARRRLPSAGSMMAVLTMVAVVLGPLLPLSVFPGISEPGRLTFVAGWALAGGLALLYRLSMTWAPKPLAILAAGIFPLIALFLEAWPIREAQQQTLRRVAAEGRAILNETGAGYLWIPDAPGWFTHSTEQLRSSAKGGVVGPVGLADFGETWRIESPPRRLQRYDAGVGSVAEIRDAGEEYDRWCQSLRQRDMRIDLEYSVRTHLVRWRLWAEQPGRFTLLSPQQFNNVSVASEGSARIHRPSLTSFRIKHEGTDGIIAYSPLLRWPLSQSSLSWHGRSDLMKGCGANP